MDFQALIQRGRLYNWKSGVYSKKFAETFDNFAKKLMQVIQKIQNGGDNFVFSPFLIQSMLSMILSGAAGETKEELISLMDMGYQVKAIFEEFHNIYDAIELEGVLKVANKIIVSKSYALNETYQSQIVKSFKSDVELMDFDNVMEAVNSINAWAAEKTGNGIRKIMQPDGLGGDTRMVGLSAIYFSGKWDYPFEKSETKPMAFWLTPNTSINVSMMYRKGLYSIAEFPELNARGLRLGYLHSKIEMIILLPNDINGLEAMEKAIYLTKFKYLNTVLYELVKTEVFLPKFEFESELDVENVLKTMGVDTLFDPSKADLSKTLKSKDPLWVSKLVQKALIKVDEEGTTATAIIAAQCGGGGGPPKYKKVPAFKIDHGFMFLIAAGRIPLFQGVVRNGKPLEICS